MLYYSCEWEFDLLTYSEHFIMSNNLFILARVAFHRVTLLFTGSDSMENYVPVGEIKCSYCKLKFKKRAGRYYIKKFNTSQEARDYSNQLQKHRHSIESAVTRIKER